MCIFFSEVGSNKTKLGRPMFKFQEKVLFEYWSFVEEPYTSFSVDFKFVDGYVIDRCGSSPKT